MIEDNSCNIKGRYGQHHHKHNVFQSTFSDHKLNARVKPGKACESLGSVVVGGWCWSLVIDKGSVDVIETGRGV